MALLLTLGIVFSVGTGVTGISMGNCGNDGNTTIVEGFQSLSLSCFDIPVNAIVKWTLIADDGSEQRVGTCDGQNQCASNINWEGVTFSKSSSRSSMYAPKLVAENFAGIVKCSQVSNDTEESASCNIRVAMARITRSSVDVRENDSTTVVCHVSGNDNGTVTWSLIRDDKKTLHLGRCVGTNSCTAPYSPQITLGQMGKNVGILRINNIQRNLTGQLTCSYSNTTQTDAYSVHLYVYNPATIENCQMDIIRGNWSLVLSCDVMHVFSSSGLYTFIILEYYEHFPGHFRGTPLFEDRRSIRHLLSPYTDELGKIYYRGRLTHSWRLKPFEALYRYFDLIIYTLPTSNGIAYEQLPKSFTVARPSQPSHNCTDLIYIPDSGVVSCECTAEQLGTPEGRLIWLQGNTPIATGHYGVRRLPFPETAVSRELVVLKAVCQLDWIDPENATLFLVRAREKTAAAATDGDQLKWAMYGGTTVLAVLIVIVLVMLWRRGQFSKCPCNGPVYDSPKINSRGQKIDTTAQHIYETMSNEKNNGNKPQAVVPDGLYENIAVMEQERHI